MRFLKLLFLLGIGGYGAIFACFVTTSAVVTETIASQVPFGGDRIRAWMRGEDQEMYSGFEALEAGAPALGPITYGDMFQTGSRFPVGSPVDWWGYAGPVSFICGNVLAGGVVTDHFGTERVWYDQFGNVQDRQHRGIDYGINGNPVGAPVHTPLGGKVVFIGVPDVPSYGNLVVIENMGVQVYLAHNQGFNVELGQIVGAGDVVAFMGGTGGFTPHAHMEFRQRERTSGGAWREFAVDPVEMYVPGQIEACDWYTERPYG